MRTDLDHLPPNKQRELERVVQILFEEFGEATALATQEWKKKGRILKVILYGSYARGGWVDEPHTAKGYQSDYDLLVIVNDKRLVDRVEYWAKAEERLIRELSITKTLRTPVNFIVHTLQEVNDGLAQAQRSRRCCQRLGDTRAGAVSQCPRRVESCPCISEPKRTNQTRPIAGTQVYGGFASGLLQSSRSAPGHDHLLETKALSATKTLSDGAIVTNWSISAQ